MFNIKSYGHAIMNYTPHSVTLLRPIGSDTQERFDSVGVARCREMVVPVGTLHYDPLHDGGMMYDVPLITKSFGAVEGLPAYSPEHPWRLYIVSQIVADACPERDDLLVPSDVVRGADGQVLGCRTFAWRASK